MYVQHKHHEDSINVGLTLTELSQMSMVPGPLARERPTAQEAAIIEMRLLPGVHAF